MASPLTVLRWAIRDAPTLRRADGAVDRIAHDVLVALAAYADRDALARPGLPAVAHDARCSPQQATDALQRLLGAGVVVAAGEHHGTPVWRLVVETVRERGEEDSRGERRRALARERTARWRARATPDGDAPRPVTVTHPAPSQEVLCHAPGTVTVTHPAAHVTDPVRHNRRSDPLEGVKEKGLSTGRGKNNNARERAASDTDIAAAFEAFWEAYPRKVAKAAARKAWPNACKALAPDRLAAAAAYWAGLWEQAGTEKQFIPHPATWLNGRRWDDEPPAAPRPRNAPPPGPVLSTADRRVLEAEMLKDRPDPRAIGLLHQLGYSIPDRHLHLIHHQQHAAAPAARALPPAGPPSGPPGPPGPPSGWPDLQLIAGGA